MANGKIKEAARRTGVRLWEVADHLGIADSTLCRQMRKELSSERQQELLDAIKAIAAKKGGQKYGDS